jgi:RsiW-degrading membrane proteinase PrsW (M82 family)
LHPQLAPQPFFRQNAAHNIGILAHATALRQAQPMLLALSISLIAAIVPTILYVMLFYWADRFEREPRWLLMISFVWGAIPAIIVSLIVELALGAPLIADPTSFAGQLVESAIVAPVVEEVAKGLALLAIFYWKRQEFDGVLDGILYGALIGFGFAMTENFVYFIGAYANDGFGALTALIYLRAILFGLNHAFYTSLIGIGLGLARNQPNRSRRAFWFLLGLSAAILTHALHNLGASLAGIHLAGFAINFFVAGSGIAITFLAIGLAWRHERNVLETELADEVGRLLTRDEYEWLTGRWRTPTPPKKFTDANRQQLLVEYANRRYRLRRNGLAAEPELLAELTQIQLLLAQGQPQII